MTSGEEMWATWDARAVHTLRDDNVRAGFLAGFAAGSKAALEDAVEDALEELLDLEGVPDVYLDKVEIWLRRLIAEVDMTPFTMHQNGPARG